MRSPVVIGALGGSGTRVIARIVREAGYFIGSNLNESEDAMEFVEFYDRWINRYLLREVAPLCQEENDLMNNDFLASVARHRIGLPAYDAPWGWKEPRSHFLLPFFHAKYPDMKLIHVIRDGRDMAFSANQNQLRKHGAAVLDPVLREAPQPMQSAALWAKINLSIAAYAESHLAGQYLVIRFESLCAQPREVAKAISNFLGCSSLNLDTSTAGIVTPPSIGRWRRVADPKLVNAVQAEAGVALRKFGYG